MSVRFRLAAMCLVIALLPAIPLSILVGDLLEKSFNVGLSATMEDALESGMTVSRRHLETLRLDFEEDVARVVARLSGVAPDSTVTVPGTSLGIDGFIVGRDVRGDAVSSLPAELTCFLGERTFTALTSNTEVIERTASSESRRGATSRDVEEGGAFHNLTFYETENRAVQFALWSPGVDADSGATDANPGTPGSTSRASSPNSVLFYKTTDPEFVAHAENLLSGRQLFAQLRMAQERLNRSFFYPFIIIYAVILLLSLSFAFLMAERLVAPIRRLVEATSAVADGDWRVQIKQKAGGEIGQLVEGFNRMVSRLDAQRQRLIDLEKMASWREMARHLAHEIKNPLLPIRLTVQEMKDQYDGEDKRYGEMLSESVRVVDDELTHLQKLVKEFSSFAKMPGLSLVPGSIDELARDVARLYPQVEVVVDVEEDLPGSVFDPDQLRRVLVNLFDNSLSMFPDGHPGKIEIRIKSDADAVVIDFSDNGPGIPRENIEKIFYPYFSTRKGGTGLGLAIVKNIVLLHGGTIEAHSREATGREGTAGTRTPEEPKVEGQGRAGEGEGRRRELEGASFTVTLPVVGPSVERSFSE